MTSASDRAGMPSRGTHRSAVGEIGGDVLRQLVFDLVLLFLVDRMEKKQAFFCVNLEHV